MCFRTETSSPLPAGHSRDREGGRELFFTQEKKSRPIRLPRYPHLLSASLPHPSSHSPSLKRQPSLKHPSRFEGGWAGRGVILGAASEIQWPC